MPHRVLILGGGFCGLEVARRLSRHSDIAVTLVEPSSHALFTPRLVDALAQTVRATETRRPHREIAQRRGYAFVQGRAVSIDQKKKRVALEGEKAKTLPYDTLVCAYGAETNYFELEGKENSLPFKTWEDLLAIEARLQPLIRQKRKPNVAVIGGGATGIEIAFALHRRLALLGCGPEQRAFTIFEAGPGILPGFLPKTVAKTRRLLEENRMDVRLATPVKSIEKDSLVTDGGEEAPADLVIWAAGVRPNVVRSDIPPTDPKGAFVVEPTLQLAPRVYAGGDAIQFKNGDHPIPKNAQNALKMGVHIAKNILHDIKGRPPRPFRYWSAGAMLWLDRTTALDAFGVSLCSPLFVRVRQWLYALRWRQMAG